MKTKIILIVILCGFLLPSLSYGQVGCIYSTDPPACTCNFPGGTGQYCSAYGDGALGGSNSGNYNSAFGALALYNNSSGEYNSAIGYYSLKANTTGGANNAFGYLSLYHNTTGANNTCMGYAVLNTNTTGNGNCAIGFAAQYLNTTGSSNCAIGVDALNLNATGNSNVAVGVQALYNNTVSKNVGIGDSALASNTTGTGNTALGYQSLALNTTAANNTAIGYNSLYNNQTGIDNVAMGYQALYNNTYRWNTAIGVYALLNNTSAESNTAVGYQALEDATTNGDNTALGAVALQSNTGGENTAVGYAAMLDNTSGADNTALGLEAGESNTTGSENTFLGYGTGTNGAGGSAANMTTGSENTFIGYNATASTSTVSNCAAIGYEAINTEGTGTMVFSNSTTTGMYTSTYLFATSDGRFKKNITPNVIGLDFINKLKPVTYNYDIESLDEHTHGQKLNYSSQDLEAVKKKDGIVYSGFVAQDVETAAKQVGYNFEGVHTPENDHDTYALAYAEFVVPLVKAVQELSVKSDSKDSTIARQQQNIDSLIKQNSNLQASKVVDEVQLATQQSEIDQLNTMVSKLDVALSECCTSYQSVTTGSTQTSTGNSSTNDAPYLNQNFPNPFSQNTTISCYVPGTAQNASIVIYNLNGQTLKTITVPATGYNQVVVAGGTLAAGDYLYTLFVNGQKVDTKKMTLTH